MFQNDASVSTMKTRSKTLPQINWDYCNFCRQKAIKKDRKLERIESSERVKYILNAARGKFDYDLSSLFTVDDVQEKAQYHSACITNYLLKWKKEHSADNYSTIKNESEHDIAFKKFLDKKAFTMSSLLDKLCSLLPEALSTKYYTAKLQTRLQNHYGDTIVIESQKGQGQSNIVFSSSISVADAIRAASKLKADLNFSEVEASFVDGLICRKIRFFMMLRRYYVALYTQSKFPKISILLHLICLVIDHYNSFRLLL